MAEIECPSCGGTVDGSEAERKPDSSAGITVARRTTGFSGDITNLVDLGAWGFIVLLPCGCEIYTVN